MMLFCYKLNYVTDRESLILFSLLTTDLQLNLIFPHIPVSVFAYVRNNKSM